MNFLFGGGFDKHKLSTCLTGAGIRIGLRHKSARNEISQRRDKCAALLKAKDYDRARITAESMAVEQRRLEAEEILQLMCELLKQRVDLISHEKQCPGDARESVHTIIWAARIVDIEELKTAAGQFRLRYGDEFFAQAARDIAPDSRVNSRIKSRLSMGAVPHDDIVELLTEIAKAKGIDFDPKKDLSESKIGLGVPHSPAEPAVAPSAVGGDVPCTTVAGSAQDAASGSQASGQVAGSAEGTAHTGLQPSPAAQPPSASTMLFYDPFTGTSYAGEAPGIMPFQMQMQGHGGVPSGAGMGAGTQPALYTVVGGIPASLPAGNFPGHTVAGGVPVALPVHPSLTGQGGGGYMQQQHVLSQGYGYPQQQGVQGQGHGSSPYGYPNPPYTDMSNIQAQALAQAQVPYPYGAPTAPVSSPAAYTAGLAQARPYPPYQPVQADAAQGGAGYVLGGGLHAHGAGNGKQSADQFQDSMARASEAMQGLALESHGGAGAPRRTAFEPQALAQGAGATAAAQGVAGGRDVANPEEEEEQPLDGSAGPSLISLQRPAAANVTDFAARLASLRQ